MASSFSNNQAILMLAHVSNWSAMGSTPEPSSSKSSFIFAQVHKNAVLCHKNIC